MNSHELLFELPSSIFLFSSSESHKHKSICDSHISLSDLFFFSFFKFKWYSVVLEQDDGAAGERVDPGLPAPARVLGLIGLGLGICALNWDYHAIRCSAGKSSRSKESSWCLAQKLDLTFDLHQHLFLFLFFFHFWLHLAVFCSNLLRSNPLSYNHAVPSWSVLFSISFSSLLFQISLFCPDGWIITNTDNM